MKSIEFVGIDVSSERLDVAASPSGATDYFDNTEAGVAKLVAWLERVGPKLVVMEATGGYENLSAYAMAEAGIAMAIVNPRQVRDFARATGKLAKTDAIDAAVLAHFAEAIRPEPRPLPDEERRELSALISRRRQLIEMITAEKNRVAIAPARLRHSIVDHIAYLKRELGETDKTLGKKLRSSPLWKQKVELLTTFPGVGPVNMALMIARLPELGSLNGKKIASLVGVAPHARDSGKMTGTRSCWGGRADVRAALYMAAVASLRHNEAIRSFYLRLRKAGKTPKVALTACMRKILVALNAMLRDNKPWTPERMLPAAAS